MGIETPQPGTIQEAQARVLEMMTPTETEAVEETVEETVEEEMESTDPEDPEVEQTLEETEEDYTDEEEEPTQTYKLKVDGEEIEVTEEELLKGYSRQSDYSKKTQELAAQRKDLEAITSENQAARERMSQLIPELESNLLQIQQSLNAEPNWDALYKQDPQKATRLERDFNRRREANKQELEKLAVEKQHLQAAQETQLAQQRDTFLNEQAKLLVENIPEWKDDKLALTEKQEIEKWALKNSYLDEERIANIMDYGSVVMMRKAWMYDQGKVAVKKAQAKSSKTLSPGSKQRSAPKRSQIRDQQARLQKSGKSKDAQALIEMMLNNPKRR
jgi:hypothetical protein